MLKRKKASDTTTNETSVPKPDREWFIARLRSVDVSQRELARRLGLDVAQVNKSLSGSRRFQVNEAVQIANELHVNIVEVLDHLGYGTSLPPVKISGCVRGDGRIVSGDYGETIRPPESPEGMTAIVFDTSSSQLAALDGYIGYIQMTPAVDLSVIGRLGVIDAVGQKAPVVGVLSKGPARGKWKIRLAGMAGDTFEAKQIRGVSAFLWIRSP